MDENDKLTEFETEEKEGGNLQEDQSVEEGDGSELWEVKKEKDEEINEEGEREWMTDDDDEDGDTEKGKDQVNKSEFEATTTKR